MKQSEIKKHRKEIEQITMDIRCSKEQAELILKKFISKEHHEREKFVTLIKRDGKSLRIDAPSLLDLYKDELKENQRLKKDNQEYKEANKHLKECWKQRTNQWKKEEDKLKKELEIYDKTFKDLDDEIILNMKEQYPKVCKYEIHYDIEIYKIKLLND